MTSVWTNRLTGISISISRHHVAVWLKNCKLLLITGSDMFVFFLSAADPDPTAKPGNSCWGRWLSSGSISAKPVWAGGDGRSWGTLTPRSMTGSFPWCSAPELSLKNRQDEGGGEEGLVRGLSLISIIHECQSHAVAFLFSCCEL